MRSSLSHNVCRQALVCHGLSARASALSIPSHMPLRFIRQARPLFRHSTRRTFLNKLFNNAPREIKDVRWEPGLSTLVEFEARTAEGVKLPGRADLIRSFRIFINHKINHKRPVNQTEAYYARLVLEHLAKGEPEEPNLLVKDLQKALDVLAWPTRRQRGDNTVKFASALYEQLRKLSFPDLVGIDDDGNVKQRVREVTSDDMARYITILTRHGATDEAARILAESRDMAARLLHPSRSGKYFSLHFKVLRAFAEERNPALPKFAKDLEAGGFPYSPEFHEAVTTFYASLGQESGEELQRWFEKPIANGQVARPDAYLALIRYSARTGTRPEWLKKALQKLCDMNPPKAWWDVILQWAVYQGKDIDHIKHMINVIAELNKNDESVRADISTINRLIAAALDNKSLLLTERIYALASDLGLRPDVQTLTLLLQARIAGHDTTGAASAFEDILYSTTLSPGSETEQAINQYIRYLCSGSTDCSIIIGVLSRVERQCGELDPDTVVAVCSNFLKNDKAIEVIDTLGLHLNHFSKEDRYIVQVSLQVYCLGKETSTARAWDCYSLLRQFFPDLARKERVQLMNGFFDRKRADMATQVFGHMRAHANEDIRPDLEAYVACFEGLGAYPDEESLQLVHNMLKTDAKIQPSTRLYNALMLAYTANEQPGKAYGFFQQIANSAEGPSYASLEIVFRTCQIMTTGYDRGKVIWDKMQRLEVEVPLYVLDAYTLMLAGHGSIEEVKNLLISRQTDYKTEPNTFT